MERDAGRANAALPRDGGRVVVEELEEFLARVGFEDELHEVPQPLRVEVARARGRLCLAEPLAVVRAYLRDASTDVSRRSLLFAKTRQEDPDTLIASQNTSPSSKSATGNVKTLRATERDFEEARATHELGVLHHFPHRH